MTHAPILVVDDEPIIVETLVAILGDEGYTVVGAHDGHEALRAVAERRPRLVLTDVMMPGMDGTQLVAHLREDPTTRDVPIVVMSAVTHLAERLRASADAILPKPFDVDELLHTVARLVPT